MKLNNNFEKKNIENNGTFNVNYGNVFQTVKWFYKIKRYYVSFLHFKTNRLMYFINIVLSGFIDGFTLFCHFTYLVVQRNKLFALVFTLGSLFYMYFTFFFKWIFILLYSYLSKIILIMVWQDNDEKLFNFMDFPGIYINQKTK